MTIRIADLDQEDSLYGEVLCFDDGRWAQILEILRPLKVFDEAMLGVMIRFGGRVEVTKQQARTLGDYLERWIWKDLERQSRMPSIPSYIVPIATSNGLWIDPALPVLQRRKDEETPADLFKFCAFCFACKGFAVN